MRKKIITLLKHNPSASFRPRELLKRLKIPSSQRKEFNRTLQSLLEDRVIIEGRGNRIQYLDASHLVQGELMMTQKGFGFVAADDGLPDVFIGRYKIRDAIHGDRVEVKLDPRSTPDRRKGSIIKILKRSTDRFIGTIVRDKSGYQLSVAPITPERGIRIAPGEKLAFSAGQVVVAHVQSWGTAAKPILVKLVEVIGSGEDPANDFHIILRKYGYETQFPPVVEKEIQTLNQRDIQKEIPNRKDLRAIPTMTIDPASAKDFDDALSLEYVNGGYRLGVHIADVSHFVRPGTELNREAYNRGTSVYFTEGVVHMLPERLSADLCSLKPGVDRLTLSALVDLSPDWKVTRFRVVPSVIHSKFRFTYQDVQSILNGDRGHALKKELKSLESLSRTLFTERSNWGSIDFDIPEPLFSLDKEGIPHEIRPSERLQSHRIVEECMLLANRLVATHYSKIDKKPIPFVFRVHEKPKPEDVDRFLNLLHALHIPIGEEHNPRSSQGMRNLLLHVEESPHKGLIENIALRTMSKARYATTPNEHFGLAFKRYTHFTSPIRRYPDLLVHRQIKRSLKDPQSVAGKSDNKRLKSAVEIANQVEMTALGAEREYIRIKQLRWLNHHIGQSFPGLISGVMSFGIFVELEGCLAEGLIHVDTLEEDSFIFDDEQFCLRGRNQGSIYRLGDPIRIRVLSVLFEKQRANFALDN